MILSRSRNCNVPAAHWTPIQEASTGPEVPEHAATCSSTQQHRTHGRVRQHLVFTGAASSLGPPPGQYPAARPIRTSRHHTHRPVTAARPQHRASVFCPCPRLTWGIRRIACVVSAFLAKKVIAHRTGETGGTRAMMPREMCAPRSFPLLRDRVIPEMQRRGSRGSRRDHAGPTYHGTPAGRTPRSIPTPRHG